MLTTIAMLVIVLGLMVSLARHVRQRSATQLTRTLLRQLDQLMEAYFNSQKALPAVDPLKDPDTPVSAVSDEQLMRNARRNNEQFVRALRAQTDLSAKLIGSDPASIYDEISVRDAWGSPIVLMTKDDPAFGIHQKRSYFFFSAGPDRKFKTTEDNIYSYDLPTPEQ